MSYSPKTDGSYLDMTKIKFIHSFVHSSIQPLHGPAAAERTKLTWGRNEGLWFSLRFLFLTDELGEDAGHVATGCRSWRDTGWSISSGGEPSSSSLESSSDAPNPDFLMFWKKITQHSHTLGTSKTNRHFILKTHSKIIFFFMTFSRSGD